MLLSVMVKLRVGAAAYICVFPLIVPDLINFARQAFTISEIEA